MVPNSKLLIVLPPSNVRDQRRRTVGAPLADRILGKRLAVRASGVTTRDDRCIAQLDRERRLANKKIQFANIETGLKIVFPT